MDDAGSADGNEGSQADTDAITGTETTADSATDTDTTTNSHPNCDFCQISAGAEPAALLYEDDRTIAFLDRRPAVRGHTVIAPRTHDEELLLMDEADTAAVFDTVQTVATALESTLEPDGFSVFHTSGPLVGTVDHAHVHLVPRFEDDNVGLSLARRELESADAAAIVSAVRDKL
ncbi:histidine triad family protein (homolog to bis(5'-nucleosyl)-tetraphosphatase) [Natrialba magadii ATCC 43099]|uniref:Histidine triad (HIT) protein n=1 Tax=Natrialba magadii (strain ATCC 43099 / DSM 3394 / CCM 3739 / CIP 104546 / IAM 13178 / JCM 8861 / NBRC 102185 / NCIMB 2190 / MS3) TaxID=547559 RepID=D3SYD1_NATMM|nr:histidine triad family protein (homolog to bis(5'-nucleosyl)-tetraphosphatase) [Natrialba magadii ATCC 43099]ELY30901.1 histidine triad (HIT) protein [Natrialba magadii ATCC 43099]